jgi:predicted MFS family arabinose efflux permease
MAKIARKNKEHNPNRINRLPEKPLDWNTYFRSSTYWTWGIFSWLPTWVQGLLSNGQKGQQERGIVMMLLGIGGIVGGILSGFLIKSFGFKKTLLGTFLGAAVFVCYCF